MTAPACHKAAGCVASGLFAILLPKCPACLAAWIALGTGLGVSTVAAARVRGLLLAMSLALLIWLVGRWALGIARGAHGPVRFLLIEWRRAHDPVSRKQHQGRTLDCHPVGGGDPDGLIRAAGNRQT